MRDRLWIWLALAVGVIIAGSLWNRPAHPMPADWYAAVWLDTGSFRYTPMKSLENCNAFIEAQARTMRAIKATACLTREQLARVIELEKAKK